MKERKMKERGKSSSPLQEQRQVALILFSYYKPLQSNLCQCEITHGLLMGMQAIHSTLNGFVYKGWDHR